MRVVVNGRELELVSAATVERYDTEQLEEGDSLVVARPVAGG